MKMIRPAQITAKQYTYPVATGGWNAIDALDAMAPNEAVTLINWFCETTYNRLRRGFVEHCSVGANETITALAAYNGAADDLLAFAKDRWYDVTTSTTATVATGFTGTEWDTTNYATAAGQYLIAVNGAEDPQIYNGTTMVAAVNTVGGVASTLDLHRVCIFNQRVYFAQKNTLKVWYLPVGQFQGALTEFDLGPLCAKGGSIAKIATWTRDNASAGANEMFVVVTTEGEVLIYTGEFPGGAWQISARFAVGQPVAGPDSVVRLGPDCILMCEDGFQPMAHYLQLGQSQASAVALSRKIGNAVTAAVNAQKAAPGWGGLLYPAGNMLIFNIPQGGGVYYQYAVNTLTGAWCEWRGQNATCWALFGVSPYFGAAGGKVYRADTGTSDNGADIVAEYRGTYQDLRRPGLQKVITMAKPIFQTNGPLTLAFGVDVDFDNTTLTQPVSSIGGGALWGTAVWGAATWGSGFTRQDQWISVGAIGDTFAPHMIIQTGSISCNLLNIQLMFMGGTFV
jgi:hypothetical protein